MPGDSYYPAFDEGDRRLNTHCRRPVFVDSAANRSAAAPLGSRIRSSARQSLHQPPAAPKLPMMVCGQPLCQN